MPVPLNSGNPLFTYLHKPYLGLFCMLFLFILPALSLAGCNRPVAEAVGDMPPPAVRHVVYRPYLTHFSVPDKPQQPAFVYPQGKPFISPERSEYQSKSMLLEIPRINYSGPVLDAVTDYALTQGIGLYDYSPLPGPLWYNANVSIAGHRDVYGCEFYEIDYIADGDELYLVYDNFRYTYVYDSTQIIEDDDWSVIFCTGYPTLTLTSCHPIGTSDYRIVVKARLREINAL